MNLLPSDGNDRLVNIYDIYVTEYIVLLVHYITQHDTYQWILIQHMFPRTPVLTLLSASGSLRRHYEGLRSQNVAH